MSMKSTSPSIKPNSIKGEVRVLRTNPSFLAFNAKEHIEFGIVLCNRSLQPSNKISKLLSSRKTT